MPGVIIDVNFFDCDETLDLRDMLRNSYAEVLVARLWAQAMKAGCENGIVTMSAERIKLRAGYEGDAQDLLAALIKTRFLVPQAQPSETYYLRGWSRNDEYFRVRKRRAEYMRGYRKKKRDAATEDAVTRNSYVTGTVTVPCPDLLSYPNEDDDLISDLDAFGLERILTQIMHLDGGACGKACHGEPLLSLYPISRLELKGAWATTVANAKTPNVRYLTKVLISQREGNVTVTRKRAPKTRAPQPSAAVVEDKWVEPAERPNVPQLVRDVLSKIG